MIEARRRYEQLDDTEQAIIREALSLDSVTRDDIVDALASEYGEDDVRDAFTTLADNNRLVREGNTSNYMMVERDLF